MAKKAEDTGSERTYLGFAKTFQVAKGTPAIKQGEKVTLPDAVVRQMTANGHSFDPPWVEPALRDPSEDAPTEETIPA